jgi:hypothetical protein
MPGGSGAVRLRPWRGNWRAVYLTPPIAGKLDNLISTAPAGAVRAIRTLGGALA